MSYRDQLPQPPQPPNDTDKGPDAGPAGSSAAHEFQQKHSSQRAPLPHELLAEWTVNAQLKFARAGETVKKKFCTNDIVNPVRVLYKWSTVDGNITATGPQYEDGNDDRSPQDPMKRSTKQTTTTDTQKGGSFRSTTSSLKYGGDIGGADSAFSSSNNSNKQQKNNTLLANDGDVKNLDTEFYGTRCRSTCNIIVTAVADFLSPTEVQELVDNVKIENEENDSKSFVFNTTACYAVQPEKSSCSEGRKDLKLCDAVCQTSDIETKSFCRNERRRSTLDRRDSRRSYDYRINPGDDLLQSSEGCFRSRVNEENSFMPSQIPSTIQTSKSSSTAHVSSMRGESAGAHQLDESCFPTFSRSEKPNQSDSQKKPRTVHIDVYCTGSEDDDQADGELSSESDKDDHYKVHDQESNSTFQTVLENEQMRLRHQRKAKSSLPRRLVDTNNVNTLTNQDSDNSKNINIGHALTKSSTAEEIQESKQLLFRKHVGDQRAVKLQNLRQKYLRQSSDDTLSFGYPNSSRSTVRDNTCSSVSSLFAGQDLAETSCKECDEPPEDPSYSLNKSDSFEYENALDRLRIRQMERLWSRSHSNDDESKLPGSDKTQAGSNILKSISEAKSSEEKSPNDSVYLQEENFTSNLEIVSETDNQKYVGSAIDVSAPDDIKNYNKFQQTSHFSSHNKAGFLQFFGPHLEHSHPLNEKIQQQQQFVTVMQNDFSTLLHPSYDAGLQRWKSEAPGNLSASATPVLTPTDLSRQASPQLPLPAEPAAYYKNFQRSGSETPMSNTASNNAFHSATPTPSRRLEMLNRSSPAISEASMQPPPFGYSLEYLDKAKMFGKVVIARKPGHHVGPTKNPSCSCESCQRWLAERFQIRGRLFSLGEMPVLKRPS